MCVCACLTGARPSLRVPRCTWRRQTLTRRVKHPTCGGVGLRRSEGEVPQPDSVAPSRSSLTQEALIFPRGPSPGCNHFKNAARQYSRSPKHSHNAFVQAAKAAEKGAGMTAGKRPLNEGREHAHAHRLAR
ncbi:hypothetical protein SKAU_G00073430 [Synaphobranchus kaupii]|uniref:Uncharacterized protein n=1 Tax=Synaphobranchus kaupii TaxID=118154 RepID=A0A9Q1G765_SYNKA|nr:hypothetical protein SKAU_G00073430 [Synaphobranchus kaupii]